jgi:hypothetical protein
MLVDFERSEEAGPGSTGDTEILNPAKACILNFERKVFLNPTALNLASLTTRSMNFANALLSGWNISCLQRAANIGCASFSPN